MRRQIWVILLKTISGRELTVVHTAFPGRSTTCGQLALVDGSIKAVYLGRLNRIYVNRYLVSGLPNAV